MWRKVLLECWLYLLPVQITPHTSFYENFIRRATFVKIYRRKVSRALRHIERGAFQILSTSDTSSLFPIPTTYVPASHVEAMSKIRDFPIIIRFVGKFMCSAAKFSNLTILDHTSNSVWGCKDCVVKRITATRKLSEDTWFQASFQFARNFKFYKLN